MLLQIREYIKRHELVSLQQLSRRFKMDEQALIPMLTIWMKKGAIRECAEQTTCQSSCFSCKINSFMYYEAVVLD